MDGNLHAFKARLVAKSYTQTYGVDYGETFSLVADIRAIRILSAIAAFYDYEICESSVAFLILYVDDILLMRNNITMLQEVKSWLSSIMYAVRCTRPDVAFANTKDMVLVYGAKPEAELQVSCYADASFQTDKDDTKSQTGTTAMSSIEVEYIAAIEASMKAVWMRKFIDRLGDVVPSNKRPMEMLCDNEPAIAIAGDPGILKGARHFQRKYHNIHEVIQECKIVLKKVHTDDNVADPFTKPMSFNNNFEHAMAIGIVPASSLM
ncbi:retrotransposon protein, putative, ty1-copia subclass [Tanacetum coccineum]